MVIQQKKVTLLIYCDFLPKENSIFKLQFTLKTQLQYTTSLQNIADFYSVWILGSYPGRVRLVKLVEHDDGGTAVVKHKSPEVCGGSGQRVRGHHKRSRLQKTVHQSSVDVVAAVSLGGDQKGERAVGRQHVHTAVLLTVTRQQRHAALLHVQVRGDWV